MGRTEKCCMYIDLRTGGLIWGVTAILSSLAGFLYIATAWAETDKLASDDKAKLDETWEYIGVVLLVSVGPYVRYIQGIIQKRHNLMTMAILCNLLWMGFIVYFCVSCLKNGNYQAALLAIPVLAIFYHGSCVTFGLYCQIKEEVNKENATDANVVEYHADSATAPPQSPKKEQV